MDTAASSEYQFQGQSGQTAEQAYAIPIDQALSIAKQIEGGTITSDIHIGATGFLGVEIQPASDRPSGDGGSGTATPAAPPGWPSPGPYPDPRPPAPA